jgi:hypothetical protein
MLTLAGALAAPLATEAQQAGKLYRLGGLAPGPPPPGLSKRYVKVCEITDTSNERIF